MPNRRATTPSGPRIGRWLLAILGLSILIAIPAGFISQPHDPINQTPMLPSVSPNPSNLATYHTPGSTTVFGWIPAWDQATATTSFQSHRDAISYVGLFWYALTEEGSVTTYPAATIDTSLIAEAKAAGVGTFAVVANLAPEANREAWDAERVDRATATASARSRHIAELVAVVEEHQFDGIMIDYESLRPHQRHTFTVFIRELSHAMHQRGKLVGVTLAPKISEGNPLYSNGSEAHDWLQLAQYADQLHLMTYEEHWASSDAGPIASLPWVFSMLEYARQQIPADKLFMGIPLYGYDWGAGDVARGLSYAQVEELIATYQPTITWDSEAGSHSFVYQAEGESHVVWFEDKSSFAAKLDLLGGLGATNYSLWRLGTEDPGIWPLVRTAQTQ